MGLTGSVELARFDANGFAPSWSGAVGEALMPGEAAGTAATFPAPTIVELVVDVEGIRALTAEYEHLYRVTGNTLPFARQEWHLAWCEHLLRHTRRSSQQPLFCVLRKGDGGCSAIVPLIMTRRRLGPLEVAAVGLVGADPALTEIRNPLVEPGYERATVRAVHDRLARIPGWDWIQWSGVSAALAAALTLEATPQWYRTIDDYLLDLPAGWPEFRATRGRNVRESLRHCYNSLRRAGHAFEFVVARDRVEVRSALFRFLQLHTLRANMPWGPKHADHFATPSLKGFLYDVCDRLAARDVVRIFQLRIADEVVASRVGFVTGNSLYLYYSGFDPAWARYSVMTTTMAEAIRDAIESGLRTVNLSTGQDLAKLRWHPRRVDFYSALVRRDSVRSRLVCAGYRVAVSGRSARQWLVKRLPQARRDWK
jgi:CelD/BcsL family acetyltransferase involved in cellulose biosynthesis